MIKSAFVVVVLVEILVQPVASIPREKRSVDPDDQSYVTVTTAYGGLRGQRYNVSETVDFDVFLGVPYAQPPVGNLRFARPEPIKPWSPDVKNATAHGDQCIQRIIRTDPELPGVPYTEDCLFLNIYASRNSNDNTPQPVMVYLHPGGYYGGTGSKYNYTNVALRGVVVVTLNYRLDAFGFLSTQDDIIPGNFGLLDAALALEFVKEIIGNFGGNPDDVTLFGASSGAALASIMTISPVTRGKFQKVIMQSGGSLCPWAVFTPGRVANVPKDVAQAVAQRLNCTSQTGGSEVIPSADLLICLRNATADDLIKASVDVQLNDYQGNMIFIPVSEDAFGVLPSTPEELLQETDKLVIIPTLQGYTTDDGSWLVPDSDNDGISYLEAIYMLDVVIKLHYPPSKWVGISNKAKALYFPESVMNLQKTQLRDILVKAATDFSMKAGIVKQARMFSRAKMSSQSSETIKHFLYQFDHRPSYAASPDWYGVEHTSEKGFVLGLPKGPDPFMYPNVSDDENDLAENVVTMWTNFAKYGNPTTKPVSSVTWPTIGHSPSDPMLLVIRPDMNVHKFKDNAAVIVWTGSSGLDSNSGIRDASLNHMCVVVIGLSSLMLRFW